MRFVTITSHSVTYFDGADDVVWIEERRDLDGGLAGLTLLTRIKRWSEPA